jgi:NAD(P)-dependent dehydrogenase (short-subunit alcohol dehydrogenase family)/acyl dehydratase
MQNRCEFEVPVLEKDVAAFAQLSADWNPLHTDAAYAHRTEFGRPIAHGALLVGFVSRVLGMYLPGQRSLILSMKVRFPKPLFYPANVKVIGTLNDFSEERSTGRVAVRIVDQAKGWCVLDGDVVFGLHAVSGSNGAAKPKIEDSPAIQPRALRGGNRPRLLVTGGTGGIGSQILPVLATEYDICCLTRSRTGIPPCAHVEYEAVDIEHDGGLECFLERTRPDDFFGIVHLSSAPVSRAFISEDLEAVRRHLRHSVEAPVLFANWAKRSGSAVKRIVLFGSTAGLKYPKASTGAYSLGKAALEHLSRLLMADLSAQRATVNVVAPTAVAVGINEGMPERARKSIEGRMPTGRLVDPRDIAQVVMFLLSEGASQINGATISVDGGLAE